MKNVWGAFLLLFIPFFSWGQSVQQVYSLDQAKLYLDMYQQFLTQTYLTAENLEDAYYLWAAVGIYGPPTLQEGESK